jgi:inorganic pyrophosphatase
LYSSVHYPGDYGFVVGTRCGDDDPLDVLFVVEEPTFPGCRVRVRPIGVLLRTKARPTRSSWLWRRAIPASPRCTTEWD